MAIRYTHRASVILTREPAGYVVLYVVHKGGKIVDRGTIYRAIKSPIGGTSGDSYAQRAFDEALAKGKLKPRDVSYFGDTFGEPDAEVFRTRRQRDAAIAKEESRRLPTRNPAPKAPARKRAAPKRKTARR